MAFYVYILASGKNGTIYTGSTEDLGVRIEMHKAKTLPGFTAKYRVDKLVWFEGHLTRERAFKRERQIKEWRRAWKLDLIETRNSQWDDLYLNLERELLEEEQRRDW
ncbi:MAG TPA: GIY-YIG nuclease family protein [Caulobacteraceae bacterium]